MIFNVIWTLFLFRGASAGLHTFPYKNGAFVSIGVGKLLDGIPTGPLKAIEGIGLLLHIGVMLGVLDLRAQLQAPAHLPGPAERDVRPLPASRSGAAKPMMSDGKALTLEDLEDLDEDAKLGVGASRGLLLEGHPRLRDLHRVRPLPGPVPGVEHREAALAQADDHGPARLADGQGAVPAGRRGQACGLLEGDAAADQGGRAPAGRRHRRRVVLHARGRQRRDRPRRAVVVRDLRCLRAAVPGRHRARRPHRRHASLPGARRVELPRRAQRPVQGHGEQGQPLEHVRQRPPGLGQGPALRRQGRR